jgi:hypothetical protein
MKTLIINSKKHGIFEILLDDEDYEYVSKLGNWQITKNRDKFYAQKRINKKIVYLHKFIMKCDNGYVDHINHNTLDNQKSNLRITSNANNLRNGTLRKNNKTGVNGVHYDAIRKKYVARIKVNYKTISLGRYNTIEEATQARKEAEVKYWAV